MKKKLNKMSLAKGENINIKSAEKDGKEERQFDNKQIGRDELRKMKIFGSLEDAKEFFDEQTVKFLKKVSRSPGASIEHRNTAMLVLSDSVENVGISFRTTPLED